jgi:hypothetical protein
LHHHHHRRLLRLIDALERQWQAEHDALGVTACDPYVVRLLDLLRPAHSRTTSQIRARVPALQAGVRRSRAHEFDAVGTPRPKSREYSQRVPSLLPFLSRSP